MLGEALKKLLFKRKKPLPLFAVYSDSGFYYLFISLSPNFSFYFSISFILSLSFGSPYLIPPYSLINSNSFPLFISLGPFEIKIVSYGLFVTFQVILHYIYKKYRTLFNYSGLN